MGGPYSPLLKPGRADWAATATRSRGQPPLAAARVGHRMQQVMFVAARRERERGALQMLHALLTLALLCSTASADYIIKQQYTDSACTNAFLVRRAQAPARSPRPRRCLPMLARKHTRKTWRRYLPALARKRTRSLARTPQAPSARARASLPPPTLSPRALAGPFHPAQRLHGRPAGVPQWPQHGGVHQPHLCEPQELRAWRQHLLGGGAGPLHCERRRRQGRAPGLVAVHTGVRQW